jgi:sarcosine oxidase/L-pipecolate oxidase
MDYGNDILYMHLTIEAIGMWKQWNKERAEMKLDPVYHETGVLLFSSKDKFSDFEKNSMKTIREAGYGHFIQEFTSSEQISKKFPQFASAVKNGFNTAYFNKAGGNVYLDGNEASVNKIEYRLV